MGMTLSWYYHITVQSVILGFIANLDQVLGFIPNLDLVLLGLRFQLEQVRS